MKKLATDVNPYDFLIADLHQVDANHPGSGLVSLTSIDKGLALGYSGIKNRSGATPSTNPTRVSAPTTIVEAQGWAI